MKAAKVGLLILAPIVLVVGLWLGLRGGDDGPKLQKVEWVDVLSGKIVSLPKGADKSIPVANEDGVRCLYPFYRRDGNIYLGSRYRASLENRFKDNDELKVDLDTMLVHVQ